MGLSTDQRPSGVAPIADGVGIDPSGDTLALHLVESGFQDIVAAETDAHVRAQNILQPVTLVQSVQETPGDIVLGLTWVQHVAQVLGIRVHAESRDAEVDVKKVTMLNHTLRCCWIVPTWVAADRGVGADDAHVRMKPRRIIELLVLRAEPPLHVLEGISTSQRLSRRVMKGYIC